MRGTLNEVARRYRFRTLGEDEMEMLRGHNNRAIVRYLEVPAWKMPLIANHMRKLVARDAGRIGLFPGVPGMLRDLAQRNVHVAIVSSNAEDNVRRILGPENAGLIGTYECGASIFGKGRKFRRVLKRSGFSPAETLCIGDETRDIEAAASAGLASGAVTWGYATEAVLREHRPTLVFGTLGEIVERVA
jgi:phosphoglycolate phosphatase